MKFKIPIAVFAIVAVALIAVSQIKNEPFAPAEDFPRGALVYVQIADLPALLKFWNESKFKGKYLESENFKSFKNRHLGLKLASRWEEFSSGIGFPIDTETLGGLAENRAAVALYDIGKLEFVFIAPVSAEIFAATKFAQHQNKFAEEISGDGTRIYRATVEADRARQKQELIYANANGRFVLATSEKLLAQTLNNINGKNGGANRLADEPSFKILSAETEPRAATVWVNQTALNQDYYFKRYWLMSEIETLENIRAGIFDFAVEEGKLIERRRFFRNQTVSQPPIETAQAGAMLSLLPAGVPFYRLQTADDQTIDEAIRETIFDRRNPAQSARDDRHSFYVSDDFQAGDYDRLGEKFDETIDEIETIETIEKRETAADFSALMRAAKPQSVLTLTVPKVAPAPLFAEFRRAAIFALRAPDNFDRDSFEAAIAEKISAQVIISAPDARLNWETKNETDASWRELKLPMLGWEIVYARSGDRLILANSVELLREIQTVWISAVAEKPGAPSSKLTVLNFNEKETAYDRVFAALAERNAGHEFFTGNVGSLLDSISAVEQIEIRENYSRRFLEEEITVVFRQSD